ncbi:hypothetical protein CMI45_00785 [Candidatus Pacearchaeota archaeon]|nr:hypothetical protein [Candidatus Pacearchaeota archaeon]
MKGGLKMDNKIIAGILIIGIIAVVAYLGTGTGGSIVSASGISNLDVEPDLAVIHLDLIGNGNTSSAAKDELDIIYDGVEIALLRAGLDRDQIKTEGFNIYQDYRYENRVRKENGFIARQSIVIETGDFDLTTKIVDASIDNGALVRWINFELSEEKQNEYKIRALEEARKDAKKKAEATASGLGKSLGKLVSVESQEFNYEPYRYFDTAILEEAGAGQVAAKEAAINIDPKDVEVTARIAVKYKLRSF